MCIIVAKKEGYTLPKKEVLKNCFDYNNDGAGYMFANNKQVFINKGFADFEKFYKQLKSDYKKYNLKNKNVVLHFRIGTSGGLDKSKTHPFAITNNEKILNNTNVITNIGVAHNGVLYNYCYNKNLSDTQNFVKDFLYYIYNANKCFYKNDFLNNLIDKQLDGSKLAILDKNGFMKLYGDFITDGKNDGVLYSNNSYKKIKSKNLYNYDYWSDYNYFNDYNYNFDKKTKDNENDINYNDEIINKYYDDYEEFLYNRYNNGEIDANEYDDLYNNYNEFLKFVEKYEGADFYDKL